jgi:iron complex outermembrane receptor protein
VALKRIDVSTSVFRLDRPFATTDPADNVFKISGDQINYGVEFMVAGRLTDRLITSSGLTVLDANITKTGNPATDGQRFVGIPAYRSNLMAEYRLPIGPGTFANVNWQLVGRRPIDDINSTWTPAYSVSTRAGYVHRIMNRTTLAFDGEQRDRRALVHARPATSPGPTSAAPRISPPRTVAASMEISF